MRVRLSCSNACERESCLKCVCHAQCVRVECSALGLNLYTLPYEVVRRLHLRPFRYCVVYYVYKGSASCTATARVSSHVH